MSIKKLLKKIKKKDGDVSGLLSIYANAKAAHRAGKNKSGIKRYVKAALKRLFSRTFLYRSLNNQEPDQKAG